MKPPLRRSPRRRCRRFEGIVDGTVDAIATDHAPHPGDEKMQEFERCPFGIIGLKLPSDSRSPNSSHPGHITVGRMVELFTSGPAGVLRMDRGSLNQALRAM